MPIFSKAKHLSPSLFPFCSADSAKRGEGEVLAYGHRSKVLTNHTIRDDSSQIEEGVRYVPGRVELRAGVR
jgi:hypothetical protein